MSLPLDIEKIKCEGLVPNFDQIKEKGTLALVPEDIYRLKTYGFCTQKHPGYFMLRIRIPGGRVTAHQLTALAEIIETHGRGAAHLTARQGLEIRFARVEESAEVFQKLQSLGLSSRSTDGHTVRNVMACPHGGISPYGVFDVAPWSKMISDYFVQQSDQMNPRLPNRLNIFFSACPECNAYTQMNDIAFVAVTRNHDLPERGFELWMGGSLGPAPCLGFKMKDFIPLADALPACLALISMYTRFFNEAHESDPARKNNDFPTGYTTNDKTRLKDMISQLGQERFVTAFEEAFMNEKLKNQALTLSETSAKEPIRIKQFFEEKMALFASRLPDGMFQQRQKGYACIKIAVPLGEIRAAALASISKIAKHHGNGTVYLTDHHDLEIPWIPIRKIPRVTQALLGIGLSLKTKEAHAMACSGIEFCSLAKTHAQGTARELLKFLNSDQPDKRSFFNGMSVHVSGCKNGCVRHALGDIGLVGDMRDDESSYRLYLGGGIHGEVRVGQLVRSGIPERQIIPVMNLLLSILFERRMEGEPCRDVIQRIKTDTLSALLDKKITDLLPQDETLIMTPLMMETP